jgi:hypothetical protein
VTRDPGREAAGLRHRLRRTEALLGVACDALDAHRPGLGAAIHAAPDAAHAALLAHLWHDGPAGSSGGGASCGRASLPEDPEPEDPGAPEAPTQHQEAPS